MPQKDFDRVLETSASQGAGDVQLAGAVMGYQSLADAGAVDGDTLDLYLEDVFPATGVPTGAWECGTYTWRTGGILQRTTIRGSSNAGQLVSWGPGLRRVGAGLLSYMIQAIRSVSGLQAEVVAVAGVAGSVPTVAAHVADVSTVAGAIGSVATVAGAIANVSAVASRVADVQTLAPNAGAIAAVAPRIADVSAVAGNIANVSAVAGNATNINAVAADKANIDLVAGDKANIDAVAGDLARIDAVAGNKANIDLVAATKNNIDAVAGAKVSIDTVAGSIGNVNAVAIDRANIDQVAGSLANVNAIAQELVALHNVAADLPSVQAVGPSIPAIQAVYASLATIIGSPATADQITASAAAALQSSQTAIAQAGLAAAQAQAASSVAQQDLSGATLAALHRSPNPVVQAIICNTSRDSDGGAWREKCAHLSWMNEPLNGSWLAATSPEGFQSELDARAVGATLGAEVNPDPTFSSAAGWSLDPSAGGATASISGGKLIVNGTGSGNLIATRADPVGGALTARPYQVMLVIDSIVSGNIRVCLGDGTIVFVAAGAGTHVFTVVPPAGASLQLKSQGGPVGVISKFSIKPVTAFVTKSGAYWPSATGGKFYRLFQNQHANSASPTAAGYAFLSSGTGDVLTPNFGVGLGGSLTTLRVQTGAIGRTVRSFSNDTGVSEASTPYLVSFHYRGTLANVANISIRAGAGIAPTDLGAVAGTTLKRAYAIITSGTNGVPFIDLNLTTNADVELGDIMVERLVTATGGQTPGAYELRTGSNASATVAGVEVFRGNTAKFPRLGGPVAEGGAISLYALDQPGRPMWGRWAFAAGTFGTITSLAYKDGKIFAGTSLGLLTLDLAGDIGRFQQQGNDRTFRLTDRASGTQTLLARPVAQALPAAAPVNNVAVMTRPTAPGDPVTGLPVPTVAITIGTSNGGVMVVVFMDDGTSVNYRLPGDGNSVFFTPRGDIGFSQFSTGNTQVFVLPLATADIPNVLVAPGVRTYSPVNIPGMGIGGRKKVIAAGNVLAGVSPAIASNTLSLVRENPSTPALGLAAQITGAYNTGWMRGDIRRAMFIDTVEGTASSTEGIANGSFGGGAVTAGWAAGFGTAASTLTAAGGVGTITVANAEANARFGQPVGYSLVQGRTYRLRYQITAITPSRSFIVVVNNSASSIGSTASAVNTGGTAPSVGDFSFIAPTSETYYFNIGFNGTGLTGDTLSYTGVSLQEVVGDRSPKAKPAQIIGALARATVGVGSQAVAYGGFSAANYAQEAYSADLDPGTGALFVSIWGTIPANVAAVGTAVDRSAAAGAYYRLGHDATGKIVGELFDGTTTKTVTSPAAYNTGQLFTASMEYVPNGAASTLSLRVNGQVVVTSTFAALLTLTNAAAPITYGLRRDLTAPWAGTLAMVKPSMGFTPFAEEERWCYEQERQMFRDGSQVTLADTGNLIGEDYDSQESSLTVFSATAKSKFVGLVRVQSETPAAGSFSGVGHNAGIKLLTRTGTNPGVDITLPAQNLKEELLRRGEDAARALAAAPRPIDFDTVAGQTDIPAPSGWEWAHLDLNGIGQREGANKQWVRLFDGFIETARLNAPPGVAWVQGELRRAVS